MRRLGRDKNRTKKSIAGIYLITNLINNKIYVGKSLYVYSRLNQHKRQLKLNKHDNSYLQFSFNKYGIENFIFEIYECAINYKDKKDLDEYLLERELLVIEELNSSIKKNGFNVRTKNYSYIWSEEKCRDLSIASLDKNNKKYVAIKDNVFWFINDLKDFCKENKVRYPYIATRKNLITYKNVEYRFASKWFLRYATNEEIIKQKVLLFDNPEEKYTDKPTWAKAEIPGIFYNEKQKYYEVSVCLNNKKYQLSRFRDENDAINCLSNFKKLNPNYSLDNIQNFRKVIKLKKAENKGISKKGKWFIARGQVNKKPITLGKFLSEQEAKECYLNWKNSVI